MIQSIDARQILEIQEVYELNVPNANFLVVRIHSLCIVSQIATKRLQSPAV